MHSASSALRSRTRATRTARCALRHRYVGQAAHMSGAVSYAELAELWGGTARAAMESLTAVVLTGVLVSLQLITADSLTYSIADGDRRAALLMLAGAVFLVAGPLSMLRKMSLLAKTSALSIGALVYLIVILVGKGSAVVSAHDVSAANLYTVPSAGSLLSIAPIIVYSLGCQVQAVQLFQELTPGPGKSPGKFLAWVCAPAVIACVVLFGATGSFGAIATEGAADGDVLRSLPPGTWFAVGRVAVGLSLVFIQPLMIFPIRTSCRHMLERFGVALVSENEIFGKPARQLDHEAGPDAGPAPARALEVSPLHSANSTPSPPELLQLPHGPAHAVGAGAPSGGWLSPSPQLPARSHAQRTISDFRLPPKLLAHPAEPSVAPALPLTDCPAGWDIPALRRKWWLQRALLSAAVLAVSFGVTVAVPGVTIVFKFIGSTFGIFLFYIYPALAYLKLTASGRATACGAWLAVWPAREAPREALLGSSAAQASQHALPAAAVSRIGALALVVFGAVLAALTTYSVFQAEL